jgi:hypothetical protein
MEVSFRSYLDAERARPPVGKSQVDPTYGAAFKAAL